MSETLEPPPSIRRVGREGVVFESPLHGWGEASAADVDASIRRALGGVRTSSGRRGAFPRRTAH
ncbi:MAG TPA: hypothetical protein VFO60_04900 [Candidatus Dormibacteraeota bacterium]|nr:hypothetical protein [Candidatus Dormibacteraeota bacterium]